MNGSITKPTKPSVTLSEILGQPDLWLEVVRSFQQAQPELQEFLQPILSLPNLEVLFVGAGSSAFVGEATAGIFQHRMGIPCRPVATTDLVTHPRLFVSEKKPLLVVSFARSGNSPESVAAIAVVNQVCPEAFHLVVTCNSSGALAQIRSKRSHVFVLPEAANDRGLAMIGSVSGMMLVVLLLANTPLETATDRISALSLATKNRITQSQPVLQSCAQLDFKRVVCLGSGPFLGLAREAHLKIQELSDGQVIGKWDSYLGFRHGPKAVVDRATLMLYFVSPDPYVAQYERDLVRSVQAEQNPMCSIAISSSPLDWPVDFSLSLGGPALTEDDFLLLPYLIPAQLLAVFKSQNRGLNPDSPSERGAIHRVVQGVTIYPYDVSPS